jgi:hypothetical protein
MKYKIQTIYADEQWRDLVDSETNLPQLFDTEAEALEDVINLEEELDDAVGDFKVVPETEYSPA